MSHIPGYTMEEYLEWDWSLYASTNDENNFWSHGLNSFTHYRDPDLWKVFLDLHEPHREQIEYFLHRYSEEDHGSWRDYCCNFDFLDDIRPQASLIAEKIRAKDKEVTLEKARASINNYIQVLQQIQELLGSQNIEFLMLKPLLIKALPTHVNTALKEREPITTIFTNFKEKIPDEFIEADKLLLSLLPSLVLHGIVIEHKSDGYHGLRSPAFVIQQSSEQGTT